MYIYSVSIQYVFKVPPNALKSMHILVHYTKDNLIHDWALAPLHTMLSDDPMDFILQEVFMCTLLVLAYDLSMAVSSGSDVLGQRNALL